MVKSTKAGVTTEELKTLNQLLAMSVSGDQVLAKELRAAIEFTRKYEGKHATSYRSLTHCAQNLLRLHLRGARCGFCHCDLRREHYDPLWIHDKVIETIRELRGSRNAVALISGLKKAICPKGKHWTKRRQRDYVEAQAMIESLCARYAPKKMNLRLIFI